jgi:hypothetical protein
MDEKGERHHPLAYRQRPVGEQPRLPCDLRGDAIAVAARGLRVERPADVDILVVPGRGVAEPVVERLDAVGPDARLLDRPR